MIITIDTDINIEVDVVAEVIVVADWDIEITGIHIMATMIDTTIDTTFKVSCCF
jgi:hypothetical protein